MRVYLPTALTGNDENCRGQNEAFFASHCSTEQTAVEV